MTNFSTEDLKACIAVALVMLTTAVVAIGIAEAYIAITGWPNG